MWCNLGMAVVDDSERVDKLLRLKDIGIERDFKF